MASNSVVRSRTIMVAIIAFMMFAFVSVSLSASAAELRVAIWDDVPGFDPHMTTAAVPNQLWSNIFDSLVHRGDDGEIEPALASRWEALDDTTWRFFLRENVVWHDGKPFTAADVKFTFDRLATDVNLVRYGEFRMIEEIEVVNDYEVIMRTTQPDPVFLNRLVGSKGAILPKHYMEAVGAETFTVQPVGTGPFKLVEHRHDAYVLLEAFEQHWRGRAAYDHVRFRIIRDLTTAASELITGGVDIMMRVNAADEARLNNRADIYMAPIPAARHVVWYLNTDESVATGDKRVREAIDYAIDNQLLIDAALGGQGVPTRARVSPGVLNAPMEYYDTYVYDPERSVALLKEAGYGPGDLTIVMHGYAEPATLEVIGAMLEMVGINVDIRMLDQAAYNLRVWDNGDFTHMAYASIGNALSDYGAALQSLRCPDGTHSRRGGWCHEEYSRLVTLGESEMNPERRAELFAQATEILLEERPQLQMYQIQREVALRTTVDWTPRVDESWWMFNAQPR